MSIDSIKKAIKKAVLAYKRPDLNYQAQDEIAKYTLSSSDFEIDPLEGFRPERFQETEKEGIVILYRPEIVQAMKDRILSPENKRFGIMVKGPHGVGKSHSLVNLVQSLRADGHIVTFIPDCENWDSSFDFVEAVCRSLGTSAAGLGIPDTSFDDNTTKWTFAGTIVDSLNQLNLNKNEKQKVHWILVVNQLNRLFSRMDHESLKDMGVLPLPFKLMKTLTKNLYVHTVVSASANNSLSYKENHPGFSVYDHPLFMSGDEIKTWKPECEKRDEKWWKDMLDSTGGCPLQISEFLRKSARKEYEIDAQDSVVIETRKLLEESKEDRKKEITKHAVYCLLSIPVVSRGSIVFDKKFSVPSGCLLKPTFPAVLIAYRILFWDDLMEYIEKNECELLATCANPSVTNDFRGRLFELIVISRFRKDSIVLNQPAMDVLPAKVDAGMVFETLNLPMPTQMQANTLFVPKYSNFPAIDLILKKDKDVWAIQVHVADHGDVEPMFRSMCNEQGWFDAFDNIYLVYLSPSHEVTDSLTCLPDKPTRIKRPRRAKVPRPEIQVSAISKDDIECLKDIQWPSASEDVSMVDI